MTTLDPTTVPTRDQLLAMEGNIKDMSSAKPPGLVTHSTFLAIYTILISVGQTINILGVLTNIVNIVVYIRMGFEESTNISLLALAVSDLGSIIFAIGTFTNETPIFEQNAWSPGIIKIVAAMPHNALTRCTAWITAFISLERCICVVWPLKVKEILTSKTVCLVIVVIFAVNLSALVPSYFQWTIYWQFSPRHNKSVLSLVETANSLEETVYFVSMILNSLVLPLTAFSVVTVCTFFLISTLNRNMAWRVRHSSQAANKNTIIEETEDIGNVEENQKQKSQAQQKEKQGETRRLAASESNKEVKVVKMVVLIALLFIISFIPNSLTMLASVSVPGFQVKGRYHFVFILVGTVSIMLECINSTANFFIYFTMSSKFKQNLMEIVVCKCF